MGKKYKEAAKLIDRTVSYELAEAVDLTKKSATAKFDETIELAVRLGVDPKKADQQIRGAVVLPHGTGKTQKVLVFAKGEKLKEAEAAGADYAGDAEYINKIQQGWFDFDVIVATPDMMGEVGKLGRVLGPKGLMPNPTSQKQSTISKLVKLSTVSTNQVTSTFLSVKNHSITRNSLITSTQLSKLS